MAKLNSNRGFTFLEIMVVILILGFLMAIAMPNYLAARDKAIVNTCLSSQKMIFTGATMYMMTESQSLEALGDKERLDALISGGYIKGNKWCECPASNDYDYNDYTIVFEGGILSDVECKVKTNEHKWP